MPRERVIEIARMGGKAVQPGNRSFSRDRALAARAGSNGGKAQRAEKTQAKFVPGPDSSTDPAQD